MSGDSSLALAGVEAYCGLETRISGDAGEYEYRRVEGSIAVDRRRYHRFS